MKNPLTFSVITVTLNSALCLEASMKSVLSQTYPHVEYLVIDGASTDGTTDIAMKYRDRIHYFVSEPDKGIFTAMNKGIRAATGDVLFFLNSDDFFSDERVLEDIAEVFNKNPDTEIVYGNQIFKSPNGDELVSQVNEVDRRYLARTTILHQSLFARRKLFTTTNGFSEEHKIVSDYEWMIKVFLINKFSYLHVSRNISVVSTEGSSHVTDFESERIKVMRKYFTRYEIFRYRTVPQNIIKMKSHIKQMFCVGTNGR